MRRSGGGVLIVRLEDGCIGIEIAEGGRSANDYNDNITYYELK